jgi:neutral ceramidase
MLEVGLGRVEITPAVGTALSGFIFRENKPSTAIDDPLFVSALALRQAGKIHLLFSYELVGIGPDLFELIMRELRQRLGADIEPQNCILTATHSHSGPPTSHLEGEAGPDPLYWQRVAVQTAAAAREAIDRLAPARLLTAELPISGLSYNRRAVLADGRVSMTHQPGGEVVSRGPVDDRLALLVFQNLAGRPIGGMLHFACHGVAVCTQAIGSDIPGQIARRFGELLGAACFFLQGAAGDLNPVVVSARRAKMLPWVEEFMKQAKGLPDLLKPTEAESIVARATILPLEYAALPAREDVLEQIAGLERIAHGDVSSARVQTALRSLGNIMNITPGEAPDPGKAAYCARALVEAGRHTLAAVERGLPLAPCPLRLSVWRLGNVALAFAAAELFAATGLKLRALRPDLCLLPVTYASPLVGYIPDLFSSDKGGYEVDNGWQFYGHPAPFIPHAEAQIIQAFSRLLAVSSEVVGS